MSRDFTQVNKMAGGVKQRIKLPVCTAMKRSERLEIGKIILIHHMVNVHVLYALFRTRFRNL